MHIFTLINNIFNTNSWDPTEQIYLQRTVNVFTLKFRIGSPDSVPYQPKHVAMLK